MSEPAPTSHTYVSQRLRLHYLDWGNVGAPPLVLVHGRQDHGRSWDWLAEHWRHRFHVVAVDLRGHGDSEWSSEGNYTLPCYVYDLYQLFEQLRMHSAALVAHSLGGNISLRIAGLFPHRVHKVVAIEGLGPSPQTMAEYVGRPFPDRLTEWVRNKQRHEVSPPRRFRDMQEAAQRMRVANSRLSATQAEHLTRYGLRRNDDGTFSWKFDNLVRLRALHDLYPGQLESLWSRIECPVLLVHGEESPNTSPRTDVRIEHLRTARHIAFEKAGHWPHHDNTSAFLAAVTPFLIE